MPLNARFYCLRNTVPDGIYNRRIRSDTNRKDYILIVRNLVRHLLSVLVNDDKLNGIALSKLVYNLLERNLNQFVAAQSV